mmetsp:Transcript_2143/g.4796  ORF Transcript_2143/g.4796 Transcript_2143/m.4796 type:complete len:206 (+) Transcript_2143:379-996(+)
MEVVAERAARALDCVRAQDLELVLVLFVRARARAVPFIGVRNVRRASRLHLRPLRRDLHRVRRHLRLGRRLSRRSVELAPRRCARNACARGSQHHAQQTHCNLRASVCSSVCRIAGHSRHDHRREARHQRLKPDFCVLFLLQLHEHRRSHRRPGRRHLPPRVCRRRVVLARSPLFRASHGSRLIRVFHSSLASRGASRRARDRSR